MQHELEEVYTGFPKSAKTARVRLGRQPIPRYRRTSAVLRQPGVQPGTSSYENPQYLGAAHRPLHIAGGDGVRNLGLHYSTSPARLEDRRGLLNSFDSLRRDLDTRRESQDMDAYTARAFDIITSPQARDAFDLNRESNKVKDRYGGKDDKFIYVGKTPDSFWYGENFLLARRLVEAGVPVVTLRTGLWDHHGNVIQAVGGASIWHSLRSALPLLDRSIHALVTDLHDRGLDKEVMVLVWGEFGRTPKISLKGPRPLAGCEFCPVCRCGSDGPGDRGNRQPRRTPQERSAGATKRARHDLPRTGHRLSRESQRLLGPTQPTAR